MTTRQFVVFAIFSLLAAVPVLGQSGGGTTFPGGGSGGSAGGILQSGTGSPAGQKSCANVGKDRYVNNTTQEEYVCTAPNTWVPLSSAGGGAGSTYNPLQPNNYDEPIPGTLGDALDYLADRKAEIEDLGTIIEGDGSPEGLVECVGPQCIYLQQDTPLLWFSSEEGTDDWYATAAVAMALSVEPSDLPAPGAGTLSCYAKNDGTSDRVYCRTSGGTVQKVTIDSDSLGTIDPDELTATDFGEFVCNGATCSLDYTLPAYDYQPLTHCGAGTANLLWSESVALGEPEPACVTGAVAKIGVADFDDSIDEEVCTSMVTPSGLLGLVATVRWISDATTGSARWSVRTACADDGEPWEPVTFTAAATLGAAEGTADNVNETDVTASISGCAPGELLHACVSRDADNATDTMEGDARALGVVFAFSSAL